MPAPTDWITPSSDSLYLVRHRRTHFAVPDVLAHRLSVALRGVAVSSAPRSLDDQSVAGTHPGEQLGGHDLFAAVGPQDCRFCAGAIRAALRASRRMVAAFTSMGFVSDSAPAALPIFPGTLTRVLRLHGEVLACRPGALREYGSYVGPTIELTMAAQLHEEAAVILPTPFRVAVAELAGDITNMASILVSYKFDLGQEIAQEIVLAIKM